MAAKDWCRHCRGSRFTPKFIESESELSQYLCDSSWHVEPHFTFEDLPYDAVDAASRAASDRWSMGALHLGTHVLLELLNQGIVVLNPENENLPWPEDARH